MKKRLSQDSRTSIENVGTSKSKRNWLKAAPLVMCGMMGAMFFGESSASAHGYIENSRAHKGQQEASKNYNAALEKYGEAVSQPQSIEAYKHMFEEGLIDGKIASGGNGTFNFSPLDVQLPNYWSNNDMKSGKNTLTWKYTAEHRTLQWKYYITKKDWNPSKKLNFADFEEIGTVAGEVNGDVSGPVPAEKYKTPKEHSNGYSHVINIPSDRKGYHVILGKWDIADTPNAFYQVMDVNIDNDGGEVIDDIDSPTIPTNLQAKAATTKVNLNWIASKDNVGVSHYIVYRDGEKLAPVTGIELEDVNLKADTEYTYEVAAVDNAGNESVKSAAITVKTEEAPAVDTEAPSEPKSLHSMGETATTVDLMWKAATDNVGVNHYEVYRNGERVHTNVSATRMIDRGLQPNKEYTYEVIAVDAAGNVSEKSNTLKVQTKELETTTWDANTVYNEGDRILYNGNEYAAKYWTQGNLPDISDTWKLLSNVALEWNQDKAYDGGEKVNYQGATYQAKWWTKGDIPEISIIWEKI